MITATQKFALAAASTTAVVVGSVLPAGAFQLTQYNFSGKTGSLPYNPCNPYEEEFYPEYQNADFQGYIQVRTDAPDQDGSDNAGKFSIYKFLITLTNPAYVGEPASFQSTVGPGAAKATVKLSSFIIGIIDADVINASKNDPTKADFQLFFSDNAPNPNQAPTADFVPTNFVPGIPASFLTLKGSTSAPDRTIPVVSAQIDNVKTINVAESVPEPTTLAGLGVVGLGLLLRKKIKQ
jgi:hypothetical protein